MGGVDGSWSRPVVPWTSEPEIGDRGGRRWLRFFKRRGWLEFFGDGRRWRNLKQAGGALDLGAGDWRQRGPEVTEIFEEKFERVAWLRDIREGEWKWEWDSAERGINLKKPLLEIECLRLDFQGFHLTIMWLDCHVIHTWKSSLRHSISVWMPRGNLATSDHVNRVSKTRFIVLKSSLWDSRC